MISFLLSEQIIALNACNLKLATGIESLIKRAITRKEFSDFYALDVLAPHLERDSEFIQKLSPENQGKIGNILAQRNILIWKIANYYYSELARVLVSECEGRTGYGWPKDPNKQAKLEAVGIKEKPGDKPSGYASRPIIPDISDFTPEQFIVAFENFEFPSSWGGKPWADIARLYKELSILIKSLKSLKSYTGEHKVIRWHLDGTFKQHLNQLSSIIDRINQAEHNSGSLFTHFRDGESSWITDALNEKAIPNSLKRLKTRVSPDIKPLLEEVDMSGGIDEAEISVQIADIELSKWQRRGKQRAMTEISDMREYEQHRFKTGKISKTNLEDALSRLKIKLNDLLAKIDNPDNNTSLFYDLRGKLNDTALFGLLVKKKYYGNLLQFVDEINLYNVDAFFLRQAFQTFHSPEFRAAMLKNFFRYADINIKNSETISFFYNVFKNLDLEEAINDNGKYYVERAIQMFGSHGLDIKEFKPIIDEEIRHTYREDEYGNILDPPSPAPKRRDKQLSLFQSARLNRLKK